jgi:hypothetical protein
MSEDDVIDRSEPDARGAAELLNGIDRAFERAMLGLRQAETGQSITIDELCIWLSDG